MAGAAIISANNIKISGDTSGLIASVRGAGAAIGNFTRDINSKLVDSFKRADKEQRVFKGGLSRLGDELTGFGQKLGLFGGLPALFAAGKAYKDFADIQKLEIGLKQYGETLEKVKSLAKLPNVSIEGAAESLISLRSVGLDAKLAERAIRGFSNAITAAGKSSHDLAPALLNLQQMLSTGTVSEIDIKEMARRIPQVRKVLQDAFPDGDYKSAGPQKVIEAVIGGLEKIPPVAGGAGMAMEQFGDSFKFASASIGDMIEKSFNVSGIIKGLGDMLDNLTDHLRALSPEAQRSILVVGSMAVIIPTVTTAIGGLIKLLPLLATGFGLVSAPVAALVTGVAVGAAAIITNWGKIKTVLKENGYWSDLVSYAKSAMNILAETIKLGLNLIQGDWANFGEALKNILKNLSNGLVTIFASILKEITRGVIALVDLVSTPGQWLSDKLGIGTFKFNAKEAGTVIDKLASKFKFEVPDVGAKLTEGFKGWFTPLKSAEESAKKLGDSIKSINSMSINELRGQLSSLQSQYDSLNPSASDFAQKQSEIAKAILVTQSQLDRLQSPLSRTAKQIKEIVEKIVSDQSIAGLRSRLSQLQEAFDLLDPTSMGFSETASAIAAEVERIKKAIDALSNAVKGPLQKIQLSVKPYEVGLSAPTGAGISLPKEASTDIYSSLSGGDWSPSDVSKLMKAIPQKAGEGLEEYKERLNEWANATDGLRANLSDSLKEASGAAAVGFGEMLGNMMNGVEGLKGFGQKLGMVLSTLLSNLGKSMISFGTAGIAIKKFITNPYVALAAGVGLVALSTALKNKMQSQVKSSGMTRFAEGGFAYGEMTAIVGDNRNARFDPEMIAPYSKVDKSIERSIAKYGGGGNKIDVEVTGVLDGDIIRIVSNRATSRNNRLRGY